MPRASVKSGSQKSTRSAKKTTSPSTPKIKGRGRRSRSPEQRTTESLKREVLQKVTKEKSKGDELASPAKHPTSSSAQTILRPLLVGIIPKEDFVSKQVASKLLNWYDDNKRDMPWRTRGLDKDGNPNPYYVWVSEIMAQQTQIATVIPYWNKWMKSFPTINQLAEASADEVKEHWAGLGYYRRSNYLHQGAQKIKSDFGGKLPETLDELKKVPGIGPYTAAAIASICFKKPVPLVDGNVLRVISRLRGHKNCNLKETKVVQQLWKDADDFLNVSRLGITRPGDWNQSLMELGATVCKPGGAPNCSACPLKAVCQAKKLKDGGDITQIEDVIPLPKERTKQRIEHVVSCVVRDKEDRLLLARRPETGLLASLYELPTTTLTSTDATETQQQSSLTKLFEDEASTSWSGSLGRAATPVSSDLTFVSSFTHIFSHIKMTIHLYECSKKKYLGVEPKKDVSPKPWIWASEKEINEKLAVGTIVKKALKLVNSSSSKSKGKRGREE